MNVTVCKHHWLVHSPCYDQCAWCGALLLARPEVEPTRIEALDEKFGTAFLQERRDDIYHGAQDRKLWQYESDLIHLVVRNALTGRFGYSGTLTKGISTACRDVWTERPRRTFVYEQVTCPKCRDRYEHPPRLPGR